MAGRTNASDPDLGFSATKSLDPRLRRAWIHRDGDGKWLSEAGSMKLALRSWLMKLVDEAGSPKLVEAGSPNLALKLVDEAGSPNLALRSWLTKLGLGRWLS